MKLKRVFIIHTDEKLIKAFKQLLERSQIYTFAGYYVGNERNYPNVGFDNYDIVIVKDALKYNSGLYIIKENLRKTKEKPELIVLLTPFINPVIQGICYEWDILCRNICITNAYGLMDLLYKYDMPSIQTGQTIFNIQYEVIEFLKKCGFNRRYLAYRYFEYILCQMLTNHQLKQKSMGQLYRIIAQHFEVSESSVERAMRNGLRTSLLKNENVYANALFGLTEEKDPKGLPSTSTFLMVTLNHLLEKQQSFSNQKIAN